MHIDKWGFECLDCGYRLVRTAEAGQDAFLRGQQTGEIILGVDL